MTEDGGSTRQGRCLTCTELLGEPCHWVGRAVTRRGRPRPDGGPAAPRGQRRCLSRPQGEGGASVGRGAKAVPRWAAGRRRCLSGPQGKGGVSVDCKGKGAVAVDRRAEAVSQWTAKALSQSQRWRWERKREGSRHSRRDGSGNARQRRRLSHGCSGFKGQRRCVSHDGGGNTSQRQWEHKFFTAVRRRESAARP